VIILDSRTSSESRIPSVLALGGSLCTRCGQSRASHDRSPRSGRTPQSAVVKTELSAKSLAQPCACVSRVPSYSGKSNLLAGSQRPRQAAPARRAINGADGGLGPQHNPRRGSSRRGHASGWSEARTWSTSVSHQGPQI